MTHDAILDRLIASDRNCRRQKKRSGRMLTAVLATWPGAAAMAAEQSVSAWKKAAVAEYRRQHAEPKSNRAGISPALLMLLAEIIIKLLLAWWQNRELTTADLTRLHRQA